MKWVTLLLLLIPAATAIGIDTSVSVAGAGVAVQDNDLTTPLDAGLRVCAIVTCIEHGMEQEARQAQAPRETAMQAHTDRVVAHDASGDEAAAWAVAVPAAGLAALLLKLALLGPGRILVFLLGPGRLMALGLTARWVWPTTLENETRQSMKAFIQANPGASIQEARHHAGVAWGTAVYHLQRMERDAEVVSIRSGNHHRYWIAGTEAAGVRHAWAVLEQPTTAMIADAVHDNPGIHQSGLCDQLHLKTPTASKHLKRLVASGLVMTKRCSRFIMYAPTERLDEVIRLRVEAH